MVLEEVLAHRTEGVDEHAGLKAYATMYLVGGYIVAVAGLEHVLLASDTHLKLPAGHIGALRVIVGVWGAHGSRLEFHFHHHQLTIVGHDLPLDTWGRVGPFDILLNLEYIASCSHSLFYYLLWCFYSFANRGDGSRGVIGSTTFFLSCKYNYSFWICWPEDEEFDLFLHLFALSVSFS